MTTNKKNFKTNKNTNFKKTPNKRPVAKKRNPHTVVTPINDMTNGYLEYNMPRKMYEELTKGVKGDHQKYLCDLINIQYGLLGACVRVVPN